MDFLSIGASLLGGLLGSKNKAASTTEKKEPWALWVVISWAGRLQGTSGLAINRLDMTCTLIRRTAHS